MTQDALEALRRVVSRLDAEHRYDPQDIRCPICREITAANAALKSLSALRDGEATEGEGVKPLRWMYCKALGGGMKWVANDPFGNEFARIDERDLGEAEINALKAGAQQDYETCIRSALSATPPVAPTGTVGREPVAWRGVVDGRIAFLCRTRDEIDRLASDYNATIEPLFAQTGTVGISDAMVERALADAGSAWGMHLTPSSKHILMRAALEAALSAPTVEGEGL